MDLMENQNETNEREKNWLLPASIVIAAVLIAGAVIYSTGLKNIQRPTNNQAEQNTEQNANQTSNEPQIGDDVVLGSADAPVTMIVFGDYQCPFCAKFFKETESLIVKNYVETGKVKMVFKDLAFLGPESIAAAEASECARDQQKYWQYHDALYEVEYAEVEKVLNGQLPSNEGNGNLNRDLFKKIASDLKTNVDEFLSCVDSRKYKGEVEKDIAEAKTAMNQRISTPTSFINGQMVQGALPYSAFVEVIDKFLDKK